MERWRGTAIGRRLGRLRPRIVARTILAAYVLVALAGAALPGVRVAAAALLAIFLWQTWRANRHSLRPGRLRIAARDHWAELTVALLALIALALRVRGIDFGRPAIVHPDEDVVVWPVLYMLKRGWIDPPIPYHYPTVFPYLLLPALALTYVRGRATGIWSSLDEVWRFEFVFYLVARYHSAVLGALTVPLLYLLCRRVDPGPRGRVAGLIAATMLTFSFVHVRESHFAVTDPAMTFFVTLALVFVVAILRDARWRTYALAGFLAGLACAAKYNAAPVVLLLPVVHVLARRPREWISGRPVVALAMVPIGFFAGYPYALLRYRPFLEHVGWLRRFQEFDPGDRLRLIFGYALESGFGALATVLLLLACLWFLHRASAGHVALVVYLAVSLYMLTHTGHRFFPRYLLPLLPAAMVLVGSFSAAMIERAAGLAGARTRLLKPIMVVATAGLLVFPQASESVEFTELMRRPDTRGLAVEHVANAYPSGTVVASNVRYFRLPRPYEVRDLSPVGPDTVRTLRRGDVEVLVTSTEQEEEITADPAGRRAWRQVERRFDLVRELDPVQLGAHGPALRVYQARAKAAADESGRDVDGSGGDRP